MSSTPPPPPPPPGGGTPWQPQGQPPPYQGTPWQPAPPPGQPYGSPVMSGANPFESRGTSILVIGILSLVICGPILGPVGWVMGSNLRKEALAAGWPEPGNAKAGRICSMIASMLALAAVAFIVLLVIIGAATSTTN